MSFSANVQTRIDAAGLSIATTQTRTAAIAAGIDESLPAGLAATLSARTDADTAVADVPGHAFANNATVDVHWEDGQRRGMTATVAGNNVTVDGGAGDDLPANNTALVVTETVEFDVELDGTTATILFAYGSQRVGVDFLDANNVVLLGLDIPAATAWNWLDEAGTATPVNGVAETIRCSCGSATTAASFRLGGLYS